MTYAIIEFQTDAEGNIAVVPPTQIKPKPGETEEQTRDRAEGEWHRILSVAATSSVVEHSAIILNERGGLEESKCYEHPVKEIIPDEV